MKQIYRQPMMTNAVDTQKKYQGIGGWLLLPLLGIAITIIQGFYSIFTDVLAVFYSGDIYYIIYPEIPYSDPSYLQGTITFVVGMIIVFGLQILSLFLLWKFLAKSKATPKLYNVWMICSIVGLIITLMMVCFFPLVAEEYDLKEFIGLMKDLGRSIFSATIWIPYFMVSKRVKNTFVR